MADFTYCSTWSGIVYVAFVVDAFSRRIGVTREVRLATRQHLTIEVAVQRLAA